MFSLQRDFSLKIICLPDNQDPDEYLRDYGVEKFHELRVWTAFDWKLNSYDDRIDPSLIRKEIVPIIAADPSPIARETMMVSLSEKIGITVDAIKEEVDQVLNDHERQAKKERDQIISKLQIDLRNNPNDWRIILNETKSSLESISEKNSEDSFSPSVFISELEHMREKELDPEANGITFDFHKWAQFNEAVKGDHSATLNVVGGAANTGKTAWMSGAALQLARNEEEDNFVIFHTIDDTLEQFCGRILTQLAFEKYTHISLNKMKNPNAYNDAQRIHEARTWAYEEFYRLIREQRILIRGGESTPNAATLTYAEEMIKFARKARPEARVIYFGDNFHRYRDFSGADERNRFKKLSNGAKDIAKRHGIPMWVTMEYNKTVGTGRPTNNSISESIAMEYDANFIMHLYSDLHSANQEGREPDVFFNRQDSNGHFYMQPRIEAIVGKNKINSFKGSLYFDFYGDQSRMEPVSSAIVEQEIKMRKEAQAA